MSIIHIKELIVSAIQPWKDLEVLKCEIVAAITVPLFDHLPFFLYRRPFIFLRSASSLFIISLFILIIIII